MYITYNSNKPLSADRRTIYISLKCMCWWSGRHRVYACASADLLDFFISSLPPHNR